MGDWRSWLARLTGSQKVTGSNPVFSTKNFIKPCNLMKKFFLLVFTALMFIGCNSDDELTIYDYIGTWSGTYTGTNDKGEWNFVVADDGKVTGTMHSNNFNENYSINGRLDRSGQLVSELALPAKGNFNGTLNTEKKGNGTWNNSIPNPARSGNWEGSKIKK